MANSSKSAANFPERKKAAMYAKLDTWQTRLASVLVIFVLCLQPLFVTWNAYINLTGKKFVFFVVYMSLVLAAVIIIWIYRMTRTPRLSSRGSLTLVDWAVLGFAFVVLLSALLSPFKAAVNVWIGIPEPEGRYDGAITELLYVAVFLIVSRWYLPKLRHFTLFGISAILIAFIGIMQFYGMDFLKLWPNDMAKYAVPNFYNIIFRSTLGNVNIVSTYVCVAMLLCGLLFVRYSPAPRISGGKTAGKNAAKRRRIIGKGTARFWTGACWLMASALNFWLMELAGADSGRVGLIVALLFAIPFIIENLKTLGRFLILASTWAAVYTLQKLLYDVSVLHARTAASLIPYAAAFVILLAVGIVLASRGKERNPEAPAKWLPGVILIVACIIVGIAGVEIMGRQDVPEGQTGNIIYEMREIMHGRIKDEFGTNRVYIWKNALKVFPEHPIIGSGPDTFKQVFPAAAQGAYGETYDKAHNEYLQILICQGILGLVSYLLFLVAALIKAIPKAFKNPLVMAVFAGFVGYCAQAFFNISLPIASQMLWVLAGMLANKRFRDEGIGIRE